MLRVPKRRLIWRGLLVFFLIFPWLLSSFSNELVFRLTLAASYALAGLSVVVLTGWLGQVSLAQGAIMGIGAFTAGRLAAELGIPFPWGSFVSAVAGGAAALIMGATALRLRGLYLAVATLAFQYAVEESLLQWRPFSGGYQGVTLPPLKWGFLDFSDDRLFFYLAWGTFMLCAVLCLNLRDAKIGRAWLTIKEAEAAASAVGVPVTRYRLGAFAVSGALAGISGSLIAWQIGHTDRLEYVFGTSILVLAVAVIGGVNWVAGAAVAAPVFALINWITAEVEFLRGKIFIFSGVLLLVSLFLEPEGIVGGFRHRLEARISRHRRAHLTRHQEARLTDISSEPEEIVLDAEPSSAPLSISPNGRVRPRETLRTKEVTVHFGGISACEDVSIEFSSGELVGLVGPNGAGKTTLLSVISGSVSPLRGRVWLGEEDVSELHVHKRAAMGIGRTFQISRVIQSLSVMENLLVGAFLEDRSGPLAQALQLPSAVREREKIAGRAREVAGLLGLSDVLDERVANLPLATARLVEMGRALLSNPSLLLLDEPASGLDRSARQLLAERLRGLKEQGIGMLLVEHDFELVSSISDRVYVMDFGRIVAAGEPKDLSRDPKVVAAYLGDRFALAGAANA